MEPIILNGTVEPRTPTAEELKDAADRAQQRLDSGDRAGAYMELYKATGNEQLLMQAQITTYSGAIGGMAVEGNFRAKMANSDKYDLTLDQFSHEIDQAVVKIAGDLAKDGHPEKFTSDLIQRIDRAVWKDHGMEKHFPGNAQFIEKAPTIAQSEGTKQAILAQDESELGRRPSEYANNPNYTIHTSKDERFITVIENSTNRIALFFDKKFDSTAETKLDGKAGDFDLEQIKNQDPSPRVKTERDMKMEYLQAGKMVPEKDLPAFNKDLPRPPENLDRVFEHDGKLYQFDDKKMLEYTGVNFKGMIDNSAQEAIRYFNLLGNSGFTSDYVLNGPDPDMKAHWFGVLQEKGIITPLNEAETKYYRDATKDMSDDQKPFQSQKEAFQGIRDSIISGSPSVSSLDNSNQKGPPRNQTVVSANDNAGVDHNNVQVAEVDKEPEPSAPTVS